MVQNINRFGYLNYFDRVFLGREELNRDQELLLNYIKLLNSLGGYGMLSESDFKVSLGNQFGTIKIERSVAIDINGNVIYKEEQDNIPIPIGFSGWLSISNNKTSIEEGVISVSESGEVVGVGTQFTKLVRGVLSKKQSRIRFYKQDGTILRNNLIYVVSEVVDDFNIVLSGSFIAESNLRFSVIGTFERDILPTQNEIFSYDGCLLERFSGEIDSIPINSNIDNKNKFAIAFVSNIDNNIIIQDKRTQFYTLLSALVEPKNWFEIEEFEEGVFRDENDSVLCRMISNNYMMEIRGSFKIAEPMIDICQLPNSITLEKSCYITATIVDTGKTISLKLNNDGKLSIVQNADINEITSLTTISINSTTISLK